MSDTAFPTCPTCHRDDFKSPKGMKSHHAKAHGESIAGVKVDCHQCDAEVYRQRTEAEGADRSFCSTGCLHEWRDETSNGGLVGDNHPRRTGGHDRHCVVCGGHFLFDPFEGKYRERTCSDDCKAELLADVNGDHLSDHWVGEDNPRWRGGKESYYGPDWSRQRRQALRRDQYRCQRCGDTRLDTGESPHVHHIIPFHVLGLEQHEVANRTANLITLCRGCHFTIEYEFSPVPGGVPA